MNRKTAVIAIAIVLVTAFGVGTFVYKNQKKKNLAQAIEDSPSVLVRSSAKGVGAADAKVHIVEFMDPGCETCREFHPFVKQLIAQNPGKVRLSVRYLPLHDGADVMVKILEAAHNQGKYWETLALMFQSQPVWASHHHPEPDKIWPLLPSIGVDVDAIRRDMNAPDISAMLEKDLADARTLGIRKTPSFFVNGKPLEPFGYEPLRKLVEDAVRANY